MSKYTAFKETPLKFQCTKQKCKWEGTYEEKRDLRLDSSSWKKICPNCGNDEFYGLRAGLRFQHIENGNSGIFVKEYKPTGKPKTMQIKLDDGSIYFAPSDEFKQLL